MVRDVCEADGVHVHAGHGYLISEFSSPHANRRTDAWGGDAERRGRFLFEIYRAIRAAVGDDFPVTAKLGIADSMDHGGLATEESLPRVVQLEAEGVDAIEVSVGIMHLTSMSAGEFIGVTPARALQDLVLHRLWNTAGEECYFRAHAQAVKRVLTKTPVILVGGIRRTETMAAILESRFHFDVAAVHPRARSRQSHQGWQARPGGVRFLQYLPPARTYRPSPMLASR